MVIRKIIFLIKIILCNLLMLSLCACWGGREINNLEIVIGIGVDFDEEPDNISITAQIVKPGKMVNPSQDGGGGGEKAYWNVNSNGKTIFEAIRNITHKTGKRLFVSHSQIVIFSKDVAMKGIQEYIDFFLRAHEMRPTTLILISKERSEALLDTKPEKELLPAIQIAKLVNNYKFTSQYLNVNLHDFSNKLMSSTTAPIAPMIEVVHENENDDIFVSEMAVFKEAKMIGILNQKETRGLLWVMDKVKGGTIVIDTPDGKGLVTLEILKSKTKVKSEIQGDEILINVEINVDTSLAEQTSTENLATTNAFEKMEKILSESIKEEILEAFEKSKELKSDIFGFGDIIRKRHRKEWNEFEKEWENVYPDIQLNLELKPKIRKTELLSRPAALEKEE